MERIPAEGTWPLCYPRSHGQHGSGWRAPGIRPPCRESCSGAWFGWCHGLGLLRPLARSLLQSFKHAQSLGLDALPASSDLNRPAANPRVPRGEGRAEGGASRRPRPSGQRDLWNPAHELLPLCSITWPHIPFCRSVCASGGSPVSHSTARYFQYTLFHLLGPRR